MGSPFSLSLSSSVPLTVVSLILTPFPPSSLSEITGHYTRERDNGRDYPPFREPASAPGQPNADRKDRPPPFDRSASSNAPPPNMGPPDHKQFNSRTSDREQFNPRAPDRDQFNPRASDREQYNPRPREYDARPSSAYDQRRVGERAYERPRREGPPDDHQPRRHPNEYPPRDVPPTANSSRPPRYPDAYDRTLPEDPSRTSSIATSRWLVYRRQFLPLAYSLGSLETFWPLCVH